MKVRSLDEVTIRDIIRIFRAKIWHILCGVFCIAILTWCLCKFVIPQTYRASFSFYAWEGANITVLNTPDSNLFYRNIVFSEKLLNDYQKILQTRTFHEKMEERLKEEFPQLLNIPYSTSFSIDLTSHFIRCEIFSHSPEKAIAAGNVMADVFKESILQLMNLDKVQVFGNPQLDNSVYFPKTKQILILVCVISFLALFLFYFLSDFFRDLIIDPDKMTESLNIPLLGTLGILHNKSASRSLLAHGDAKHYQFDYMFENFQMILANLRYSIPKHDKAYVCLITSIVPGEGKSFVSSNTAMFFAEKNKRVLLVGCDIRKPTLHEFFGLERAGAGLVDVLLGEVPFDQAVHRSVCGINGLDVLLSGPIPPNPVKILELFVSSNFLDSIKNSYDYIILDVPPCIEMADVYMLGPLSDGIIFVTKCASCPAFVIKNALDKMRVMKLNILGGILNFFDAKHTGYGYGYGSYGGYYEENEDSAHKTTAADKAPSHD